jgi:DnaJ-class molecular chaperone
MPADAPESPDPVEPRSCPPCRGTGRLRSKSGGSEHEVPCPWCEGQGVELPGHDAQAARRAAADAT